MEETKKIEELYEEIARLEEIRDKKVDEKINSLIGTCFKYSHTSREIITEVYSIYFTKSNIPKVSCGYIEVYFDPDENNLPEIFVSESDIALEDIENNIIPKEEFFEFFNEAYARMEKSLLEIAK
jgi:hypothetical protein